MEMTWNQERERLDAAVALEDTPPNEAVALLVDARKRAFDAEHKAQLLQAELDALKAAHAWIKTSERLPSHGERCLVYADLAGTVLCAIGQYIPYGDSDLRPWQIQHGQDRFLYAGIASIVGWMPLPEAPK
jgi:hypothetical protein